MAYDHYAAARDIAARLDQAGLPECAARLRDEVDASSTATEILIGLHGVLADLRGETLPELVASDVVVLLTEIERSLPGVVFTP
jgi:hypothetical protein